jgi:hypothetical protein
MRRVFAAVLVVVFVLAGLVGCSPAVRGLAGVRLDAAGRPVAVLGWCAGSSGTAEIRVYRLTGIPTKPIAGPVLVVKRSGAPARREYEEVSLFDPPTGWRVKERNDPIDPYRGYEIRAWNADGMRVLGVHFVIADLTVKTDRDHPILMDGIDGGSPDGFVSPEEFRQAVAVQCH